MGQSDEGKWTTFKFNFPNFIRFNSLHNCSTSCFGFLFITNYNSLCAFQVTGIILLLLPSLSYLKFNCILFSSLHQVSDKFCQ